MKYIRVLSLVVCGVFLATSVFAKQSSTYKEVKEYITQNLGYPLIENITPEKIEIEKANSKGKTLRVLCIEDGSKNYGQILILIFYDTNKPAHVEELRADSFSKDESFENSICKIVSPGLGKMGEDVYLEAEDVSSANLILLVSSPEIVKGWLLRAAGLGYQLKGMVSTWGQQLELVEQQLKEQQRKAKEQEENDRKLAEEIQKKEEEQRKKDLELAKKLQDKEQLKEQQRKAKEQEEKDRKLAEEIQKKEEEQRKKDLELAKKFQEEEEQRIKQKQEEPKKQEQVPIPIQPQQQNKPSEVEKVLKEAEKKVLQPIGQILKEAEEQVRPELQQIGKGVKKILKGLF